jgi:hypothetical protein
LELNEISKGKFPLLLPVFSLLRKYFKFTSYSPVLEELSLYLKYDKSGLFPSPKMSLLNEMQDNSDRLVQDVINDMKSLNQPLEDIHQKYESVRDLGYFPEKSVSSLRDKLVYFCNPELFIEEVDFLMNNYESAIMSADFYCDSSSDESFDDIIKELESSLIHGDEKNNDDDELKNQFERIFDELS